MLTLGAYLVFVGQLVAAQPEAVVQNPDPAASAPRFVLDQVARADIGGDDAASPSDLWDIRQAVLTSSRGIVVAFTSTSELREFTPDGRFVRRFGRAGEGPGEYRAVTNVVALAGDSLLIYDAVLRRLTVLDADRRAVRTIRVEQAARCCSPSGMILLSVPQPSAERAPDLMRSRYVVGNWRNVPGSGGAVSGDESAPAVLSLVTSPPRIVLDNIGQSTAKGFFSFGIVRPVPFHVAPVIVFGENAVIGATGDAYEYRVYSSDGRLQRTVRAAARPEPVTRADALRARSALAASVPNPAERERLLAAFDGVELPQAHPAVDRIVPDDSGHLWVRSYSTSAQPARWSRFSAEGRLEGSVEVPVDWEIVAVADTTALLLSTNPATGMQHLRVQALVRTAAR